MPDVAASEEPEAYGRMRGSGFWTVAFAFLIVMAVATLPSPLYGLYRTRDHLSALTITVVFAIFAGSTIGVLQRDSAIAARIGRRGMMLAAVATMMLAMGVLAAWKDLPGLLIGRVVTGVSVGLAAGVAITYLVELRLRADPKASVAAARTVGTSVTIGALGVGPLIAGCLAQWAPEPLTVPYLVFVALGVIALAGLWTAPETGTRAPRPASPDQLAGSKRREVRLPVPAAAATLAAFSANGLFAGLSGLFLATTLHQSSHALAGVALFLVFAAGVASQLATTRMQASRVLGLGTISMLTGLVLLVVSVRLSAPSLALVPDRGRADRRGLRCRLQGDVRDRARGKPAGKPRRDDVGSAHRALRRTLGSGDRSRGRARPRRERTQHRARLRHPRRAGCRRLGLGTAGTPSVTLRRCLTTTGRRDDMSIYFATASVQGVAS